MRLRGRALCFHNETMAVTRHFRSFGWCLIPSVSLGMAVIAACGGDIESKYGPPGGLRNVTFPSASDTGTGTGTAPPPDAGGDGAVAACAVSFKTDIYPSMQPNGNWKCSNSTCHGTAGGTPPFIDPASSDATHASLKVAAINGKPYFNTTSTDPAQSTFECNLKGACGAGQMPVAGGAVGAIPATAAEITKVDTWLKCGSPKN
jgi:hypothetical protein